MDLPQIDHENNFFLKKSFLPIWKIPLFSMKFYELHRLSFFNIKKRNEVKKNFFLMFLTVCVTKVSQKLRLQVLDISPPAASSRSRYIYGFCCYFRRARPRFVGVGREKFTVSVPRLNGGHALFSFVTFNGLANRPASRPDGTGTVSKLTFTRARLWKKEGGKSWGDLFAVSQPSMI